jgi:hypothetical protein
MAEQDNKPFTFESEAQFIETVNKIVGGHVTKRFDSFETRLDGKFAELVGKISPQKEDKQAETEERLTLKSLQKDLEKVRAERDAERQSNKEKTLRASLAEQLTKAGLTPAQQKPVISMFINEKLASLSEEGEAQFVGEYKGEFVPLSKGVETWMKTEGKDFLPPPNGANARNLKTQQRTTIPVATEEEANDALVGLINNHFGRQ